MTIQRKAGCVIFINKERPENVHAKIKTAFQNTKYKIQNTKYKILKSPNPT
jgi:hypothetical protein